MGTKKPRHDSGKKKFVPPGLNTKNEKLKDLNDSDNAYDQSSDDTMLNDHSEHSDSLDSPSEPKCGWVKVTQGTRIDLGSGQYMDRYPGRFSPRKNNLPDLPIWLAFSLHLHQCFSFSDTHSFRLILVVFRKLIELGDDAMDEDIHFIYWFTEKNLRRSAPGGLLWLHESVYPESLGDLDDELPFFDGDDDHFSLGRLLIAFNMLCNNRNCENGTDLPDHEDPLRSHFQELIISGWNKCEDESLKTLLYRTFEDVVTDFAWEEFNALRTDNGGTRSHKDF